MTNDSSKPVDSERGDFLGRVEDAIIRNGLRRLVPRPARALYRRYRQRHGVTLRIEGVDVRFRGAPPPAFEAAPDADFVGIGDAEALRFFAMHIHSGDWVADVGAFKGTYALVAAAIAGSEGRVFAFEPTPESRADLEDNIALNGWQNRVTTVPMAVGAAMGEIDFFSAADSSTNSLFASAVQSGTTRHRVAVTTLDAFFARLGRLPNIVKIDVEGAELHVLRGAAAVLDSDAHFVCELHPYAWQAAGHDFGDFQALVKKHGRRIIQLTTGDDVVTPRYGPVALIR